MAEIKDIDKWVACFTDDGIFNDVSAGVIYRGPKELGITVEIYAKAFPDMHRELYDIYVSGDVVVVELSLNGTHRRPLQLPIGTIPPTGKVMKTPCCDVFRLKNGKVQVIQLLYGRHNSFFSDWGIAKSRGRLDSLLRS